MINLPFWFQMPTADFTLIKSMCLYGTAKKQLNQIKTPPAGV